MVTPYKIDSLQHQVLRPFDQGSVDNDWYSQVTDTGTTAPLHGGGNITFSTSVKRTADHACSLKMDHLAARGIQVRSQIPTGEAYATGVVSFYFRTVDTTNPSGLVPLFIFGATNNGWIRLNTSGQVTAQANTGTTQASSTDYCDGEWHRVDAKYTISGTTATLDVQVDGTAITQATGTATSGGVMDSWNFGFTSGSADYTTYYSDLVYSVTSGDYPIGDHICKMLEVNGAGTHSKGSGAFQDQAGSTVDANLLAAFDDAWDGTTPELSQTGEDYVRQTANDGAAYLEFTFEDPSESTIWGAQLGVLMAAENATTPCNGEARLVDSGGTTLATTGLVDPSESSTVYNGYRVRNTTAPSGGWDGTKLSGCKVRVGFSTDAAPDVAFNSAIIEYVAPWSGSTQLVIQDAAHAHAADNLALTQHNVLAIQDATHGHTADGVALTQHNVLVIQDATHGHTADNVTLLGIDVRGADALHAHTADSLSLTQHHVLAIQDASHGHAADNLALTQHNVLSIADASHAHAADSLTLTQHNVLAIADALHAHAADNLVLTPHDPTGSVALVIQDAAHAHAADNVTLIQHYFLVTADAAHAHAADNLALTQHNILAIADALHAHTADNIADLGGEFETSAGQDTVVMRRRKWTQNRSR